MRLGRGENIGDTMQGHSDIARAPTGNISGSAAPRGGAQ